MQPPVFLTFKMNMHWEYHCENTVTTVYCSILWNNGIRSPKTRTQGCWMKLWYCILLNKCAWLNKQLEKIFHWKSKKSKMMEQCFNSSNTLPGANESVRNTEYQISLTKRGVEADNEPLPLSQFDEIHEMNLSFKSWKFHQNILSDYWGQNSKVGGRVYLGGCIYLSEYGIPTLKTKVWLMSPITC